MSKNLYLNIDDDVTKAIRKIKRVPSNDITLVLPKGALLFSDYINLKLLKRQTDGLGKTISVLTQDPKGQQRALEVGFELKSLDALRPKRPSMDVVRKEESNDALAAAEAAEMAQMQPQQTQIIETPSEQAAQLSEAPHAEPEAQAAETLSRKQHEILPFFDDDDPILAHSKSHAQNSAYGRKWLWTGIVSALVILILFSSVILPEARITVYAHTSPLSRDLQINIDKNAAAPDNQQLILPGQIYDKNTQVTKTFNSTGSINAGSKATGTIQIYNYTGKTLKLGAGTTEILVGNKLYHFQHDVLGIKPTRNFGGTNDPDPASLIPEVPIIADTGGEDYNVPANTRFEINNLKLGPVPKLLWAKNTQPIQNGSSKFSTVVSKADLDNANKQLASEIVSEARQELSSQGLTLIESGANIQVQSVNFDKNVNDEAASFSGTINAHITGLAYSPSQLQQMVEQRVALGLDANKYLATGQKEVLTPTFKNLDLNAGKGLLVAHFESLMASKVDANDIINRVKGKDAFDIKEELLADPSIDRVDIDFSPSYVSRAPRIPGRVKVDIKANVAR